MSKEIEGLYEFGEYRLDVQERLLLRGEQSIPLTPKVFDTLLVLVQRSGRLVGKDELMKEVWSDAFVEEANVARNVWTLRKALGDDDREHRYIETIPKIGYRFVEPVRELSRTNGDIPFQVPATEVDSSKDETPPRPVNVTDLSAPTPTPVGPKTDSLIKLKLVALLIVFAAAVVIVAVYLGRPRRAPTTPEPPIKSLAILPLKSLGGDQNDDYLGLGIAAGLITKVSQAGTIQVRPYSAVRNYAGQQSDSVKAAQQLGVDAVLDGTVQRAGEYLRISVNLLRTQDGVSLWAENFDVRLKDVLTMQDEVSQRVATRLRLKLRERNTLAHTPDPNAYDYYMKAKSHGGLQNANDNDAAIELLERAIAIDSNFAAAYADLAVEYRNKAVSLRPDEKQWEAKAFAAVNSALKLDPDLAEAHVSYAELLWTPINNFPHEIAVQELQRALELNPNLDEAHHQLASVYNHIGLLEKAQGELQKALAINPTNTGAQFRVGVNLTYQSKYDQALIAFGERPNKFNPPLWGYQVAFVLYQLRRRDEAAAIVEKYLKEYPQDEGGTLTSMRAMLAAAAGNREQAIEDLKRSAVAGKDYVHFHHTAYTIASTFALMNNREEGVKWLRATAEGGFPCYPLFERDPNLNNLREDPNFQALMKSLKPEWERYKEKL